MTINTKGDATPGCQCGQCVGARRRRLRAQKLRDLGRPNRVPREPARKHVEKLVAAGWSLAAIAEAAGVHPGVVADAANRTDLLRMDRVNREAILKVDGPPRNSYLDQRGTVRRLQALAAIGWPMQQVCVKAGLYPRYGAHVMTKNQRTVIAWAAAAIADVYDELCMTPAPESGISKKTRNIARKHGYIPPLAWDDIDNDPEPSDWEYRARRHANATISFEEVDPVVVERILAGDWRLPATPAERSEVARRWVAEGRSVNELARISGWKADRYIRLSDREDAA